MAVFNVYGMSTGTDTSISLHSISSAMTDAGISVLADRTSNALENKISIELLTLYEKTIENIYSIIGDIVHDDSPNEGTTVGDKLGIIQGSISTIQNLSGVSEVFGAIAGVGLYDNGYNGDVKYVNVSDTDNINIKLYPLYMLLKYGSGNYTFTKEDEPEVNFSVPTDDTDYHYIVLSLISGQLFTGNHNPIYDPSLLKAIQGYTFTPAVDYATAPTDLDVTLNGDELVDGHTTTTGDIILVKDQTADTTNGYQRWLFDSNPASGESTDTGLTDGSDYSFEVAIDGGASSEYTITASASYDYTTLITDMNTVLSGATATYDDSEATHAIKITSDTSGVGSTISITDVNLFSSISALADAPSTAIEGTSYGSVENGIYEANSSGDWTRLDGSGDDYELQNNMIVNVLNGTTNSNTAWVLTTDDPITAGADPILFEDYKTVLGGAELIVIDGASTDGISDIIKYEKEGNTIIPLFKFKFEWDSGAITDVIFEDMRTIVPSMLDIVDQTIRRASTAADNLLVTGESDIVDLSFIRVTDITLTNVDGSGGGSVIITKKGLNKLITPELLTPSSTNDTTLYYIDTPVTGSCTVHSGGYSNFNTDWSDVFVPTTSPAGDDILYNNTPVAFYYKLVPTVISTPITMEISYDRRAYDVTTGDQEGLGASLDNFVSETVTFQLTPDSGYVDSVGDAYTNFVYPLAGGILYEDENHINFFTSTITSGDINNQYLDIGSGIKSSQYTEKSILAAHIDDDQIKTTHIDESNVTYTEVAPTTLNPNGDSSSYSSDGTLTKDNIAEAGIRAWHIGDDEIKENHIATGEINSDQTGVTLNRDQIAADGIRHDHIQDNAVQFDSIDNQTINSDIDAGGKDNIANNAIREHHILAGEINKTPGTPATDHIAENGIKTRHITDANVTEDKIANANITEDKIANNAVTTNKIADSNVILDKLNDDCYGLLVNNAKRLTKDGSSTDNSMTANDIMPIGTIIAVHPSAPSWPNPNYWAHCGSGSGFSGYRNEGDGDEAWSGTLVPNLEDDIFLMGGTALGTGGSNEIDLSHTHTVDSHTHAAGDYYAQIFGEDGANKYLRMRLVNLGSNTYDCKYAARVNSFSASTKTTQYATGVDGISAGSGSLTTNTGGEDSHDNRPSYFAVRYFMRYQ